MIKLCVRKVRVGDETGWAICQEVGGGSVLITREQDQKPKYGLFQEKELANNMLRMLRLQKKEKIVAYVEDGVKRLSQQSPIDAHLNPSEQEVLNFAENVLKQEDDPYEIVQALLRQKAAAYQTELGIQYDILIGKFEEL